MVWSWSLCSNGITLFTTQPARVVCGKVNSSFTQDYGLLLWYMLCGTSLKNPVQVLLLLLSQDTLLQSYYSAPTQLWTLYRFFTGMVNVKSRVLLLIEPITYLTNYCRIRGRGFRIRLGSLRYVLQLKL